MEPRELLALLLRELVRNREGFSEASIPRRVLRVFYRLVRRLAVAGSLW